jgi:hypothetical protein
MTMVIGDIHVALAEYIRYGVWELGSIIRRLFRGGAIARPIYTNMFVAKIL